MSIAPVPLVASPCVQICSLDADRVCIGCGRSIDEIAEWSRAGDRRRLAIRAEAERRLALIRQRHSTAS